MVATVVVLSLAPAAPLPEGIIENADKLAHGLVYGILMSWFAIIAARDSWIRLALGLFALGIALECCQALLPYRTGSLADVFANTCGIALGAMAAFALTTGSAPAGRAE
jgi:VanZ family protein